MKKISAIVLSVLMLVMLLSACGNTTNTNGSSKDYAEAISSVMIADELKAFPVITSIEDQHANAILTHLGLKESQMRKFAASVSQIIVNVHTVVIVLPAEGQEQAVKEALEAFVLGQQKSQENYLPLQYEITKNAQIKTTDTGEIVLVMKDGAVAAVSEIITALKD